MKSETTALMVRPKDEIVAPTSEVAAPLDIRSRILTIRGVQVMLDRDLAVLYGIETKVLNQAVKRNIERFPEDFLFQLSKTENSELVTNCDRFNMLKHSSVPMTAFTEHGILMLSSVLKCKTAAEVNIRIMREFVAMRRTLASLAPVLTRLDAVERRQIMDQSRNEERFKLILDAMRSKDFPPQKVFFNGEVFDAEAFATKYILSAKKSIVLIDSWVDTVSLEILAKKRRGVTIRIVSSPRGNHLSANDIVRFNTQYGGLTVETSRNFHDRFLIVDNKNIYLFGASLKNLGEKCFVICKLDSANIPEFLTRLNV